MDEEVATAAIATGDTVLLLLLPWPDVGWLPTSPVVLGRALPVVEDERGGAGTAIVDPTAFIESEGGWALFVGDGLGVFGLTADGAGDDACGCGCGDS